MPVPIPRKGESKNNFISRYVKATRGQYPERQATQLALKAWDEAKRKK